MLFRNDLDVKQRPYPFGSFYITKLRTCRPKISTIFFPIFSRCTCEKCEISETPEENMCCSEKGPIRQKIEQFNSDHGGSILCITEHPGFASNCLDVWVLQTAYLHYKQQYRTGVDGETNEYVSL